MFGRLSMSSRTLGCGVALTSLAAAAALVALFVTDILFCAPAAFVFVLQK